MEVIENKETIIKKIESLKKQNLSIGFVPTMGALHEGHMSLIQQSVNRNNVTICSIFVNPTQFNNPDDLLKYPRDLNADLKSLEKQNCTIVFTPSEKEMYPEKDTRIFDFEGLDIVMEGKFRPGHFNGVGQIVSKLFEIVKPDRAYFGLKDFQQLAIIKLLERKYQSHLNIEIVPCEIIRESDGLAMSSRNVRLNSEQRKSSALISKTLFSAQQKMNDYSVENIKKIVVNDINADKNLKVEYLDIVDSNSLQSIEKWEDSNDRRACIAVNVGEIRLIDNVKI